MTTPTTINWRRRDEHPETFLDGETLFVQATEGVTPFDVIRADVYDDGSVEWYANGHDPWRRDWDDVVRWVPIEEIDATLLEPTETTDDA